MSFARRTATPTERSLEFTAEEIIGKFGMTDSGAHKEIVYGHWTGMASDYYIISVKSNGNYGKGIRMSGEELDELTGILVNASKQEEVA